MKKIIQMLSLLCILLLTSCASTVKSGQERGEVKSTKTTWPLQIDQQLFEDRGWNTY